MKTIILLLSLIAFTPKSSINQTIRTYQKDKLIHFSTGVMVSVVCSEIYYKHKKNKKEATLFGMRIGVLAGLTKELYDSTGRGNSNMKDFLWTATGSILPGLSLVIVL
jgi:uncharacterized protein YfiM (DUF2279 family)